MREVPEDADIRPSPGPLCGIGAAGDCEGGTGRSLCRFCR